MTSTDLEFVSQLGIRSKASWGYDAEAMAVFSDELTIDPVGLDALFDAQVVVEGGGIVGYFTLRLHDDGCLELEHMFVEPDWFRAGIGSALIVSALASASGSGFSEVTIICDPNATEFYLKHGAKIVGGHQSSIAGREIPVLSMATAQ